MTEIFEKTKTTAYLCRQYTYKQTRKACITASSKRIIV